MKRFLLLVFSVLSGWSANAQQQDSTASSVSHYITVHYLYGSKPAKGHRDTEPHYFGGMHGGHVYLEFDSTLFSFTPNRYPVHLVAHHRRRHSGFGYQDLHDWCKDTSQWRITSVTYPLNDSQYTVLKKVAEHYAAATPYDYAFFGMRCAAAAYDVLAQVGVVKKRSKFGNVFANFYPKLMRKRMLRDATEKGLKVVRRQGRASRKWEKD